MFMAQPRRLYDCPGVLALEYSQTRGEGHGKG